MSPVQETHSNPYTPPTTRSKTYLEAAQTLPETTRTRTRRCEGDSQLTKTMSHTQVRADKATTNHEENNYSLFSLSADTGTAQGSNLLLYITIGLAILGMYLQFKTWKANRTKKGC